MSFESITAVKVISGIGGILAVDTVPDLPLGTYEKFGAIGLLIVAVYVLWVADQRRQTKLEKIIEDNTKAFTEVRDAMRGCQK